MVAMDESMTASFSAHIIVIMMLGQKTLALRLVSRSEVVVEVG